jgi:propanol-preferring alcohol dehydrogenase
LKVAPRHHWPVEAAFRAASTIADLYEVVAMYKAGQIRPDVELFAMEDALEAYRKLEGGELSGRAVVVPHMTT